MLQLAVAERKKQPVVGAAAFTPSQAASFERCIAKRLQIIWCGCLHVLLLRAVRLGSGSGCIAVCRGPPGSGKTFFLALAILRMCEYHRATHVSLRSEAGGRGRRSRSVMNMVFAGVFSPNSHFGCF